MRERTFAWRVGACLALIFPEQGVKTWATLEEAFLPSLSI